MCVRVCVGIVTLLFFLHLFYINFFVAFLFWRFFSSVCSCSMYYDEVAFVVVGFSWSLMRYGAADMKEYMHTYILFESATRKLSEHTLKKYTQKFR